MRSRPRQSGPLLGTLTSVAVVLASSCAAVLAQEGPERAAGDPAPTEESLAERQRVVRDRLQRLESSMLKLSRLLAESEPAKAERLRDALQFTGSHRIKDRVEKLAKLLDTGQYGEADRQQELLLTDLDSLLTLLTSSLNEVERRRAERQRLEALKQAVRALIDEQTQILYRTQHAEQWNPQEPGAVASDDVAEMLRQLEQLQRLAQRRADDLRREMQPTEEEARPTAGEAQVGQAARQMRVAADRLGESDASGARENQLGALEQLQQALDELDDALRQVRREESEETLAALEARFQSMLRRERDVLEAVVALERKGMARWTRVDQLQLTESAEAQRGVHEDCEDTRRILVDEGTTVIVPELMLQLAADMAEVSERLDRSDTAEGAQHLLADIVDLLEEVLGAIERKRADDARLEQEGQPSGDGPRSLLPASAELKLLRSAQLRLNQRTSDLNAPDALSGDRQNEAMQRLSERQRRLADLARRMNERQ